MSDTIEQPGLSLVFTDQDRNYYLIPAEVFAQGRVSAERKAEIEQLLREREVTGYLMDSTSPLLVTTGPQPGVNLKQTPLGPILVLLDCVFIAPPPPPIGVQ